MTDEEKRRQAVKDIQTAEHIQTLLNDPHISGFFIAMKAENYEAFRKCAFDDDDGRLKLALEMQVIERFEKKFHTLIKQGERGKQQLSFLEKTVNKLKQVI